MDKRFCRGSGSERKKNPSRDPPSHAPSPARPAPIENYVTEFLPDVARRIHLRVVLFQQIINQVAKTPGTGSP
jgi:hypothetical protein